MFDITPILEKYNLKTVPITIACGIKLRFRTTISYFDNPIRCVQDYAANEENPIQELIQTIKKVRPLLPVSIETLRETHREEYWVLRKNNLIPNIRNAKDILDITMAVQPAVMEVPVEPK